MLAQDAAAVFVQRSFGLTLKIVPLPPLLPLPLLSPPMSLMSNLQATIFIALLSLSPMFAFAFLGRKRGRRRTGRGQQPANEPSKGLAEAEEAKAALSLSLSSLSPSLSLRAGVSPLLVLCRSFVHQLSADGI